MDAELEDDPGKPAVRLCRECHAEVGAGGEAAACPACGGALVPRPGGDMGGELGWGNRAPRETDRRGILLPRRHAVGGVITPR